MSAPKILYTTGDASLQSGAFRQVLEMSKHMGELGFRSVLVLPEAPPRSMFDATAASVSCLYPDPGSAVRPGVRGGRDPDHAQYRPVAPPHPTGRGRRRARQRDPRCVRGRCAAKMAGVPCVWHLRADLSSAPAVVEAWLPRIVLALSTRVVAVSASAAEHTFKRGARNGKISVIHNPRPDPSVFHLLVDGSSVRREFGLVDDAFLVTLVAKLSERKGHDVFIRAAPKVLASFPDTRFVIVGGELEGEHHRRYSRSLRRLLVELGVEEAVVFAGYRPDVHRSWRPRTS